MKIKSVERIIYNKSKQFFDVVDAYPYNNFLIKTKNSYICSHNCNFFDEISFIPVMDIEKQKARAIDMIDTAVGGMKTRFTHRGKNPGIVILASSKRSEKSFLEEHMKKKAASDGDNTLIVDEAVWKVKPPGTYSDKVFHVAVGNRFLSSEVLSDDVIDLSSYINKGYRIIDVPVDLRPDFLDDIDRALCDYAGISSSDLTTYISGARWAECKTSEYRNPFNKDIIEVGNNPQDTSQYYDFFDLSAIPKDMISRPLYVHLDMSISGDKTGIAGVWIKGKKPPTPDQPPSKDLIYQPAFSVSIKAPRGYQVSFEKNRNFIRWLRQQGFNIKFVSSDTFQSYDLRQTLETEGFHCGVTSVDRVDSNHICVPYQHLKSVIYEHRIIVYENCKLLTEEIIALERNSNTGRVDHPESGSKDQADALTGALYNASLHAEEYAFEHGEDIDSLITVSSANINSLDTEFENDLKSVFAPKQTTNAKDLDFGMGPSVELGANLVSEGIMVW